MPMTHRPVALAALLLGMTMLSAYPAPDDTVFMSFDRESLPEIMRQNDVAARIVPHEGVRAMRVDFHKVDWPNVFFEPPEGVWDWRRYAGIAADVFNPGPVDVDVCMRVDNAGADGANHCNNGNTNVPPGQRATLQVRFNTGDAQELWGMRGVPIRGPVGSGPVLDTAAITAFQVFLPRPPEPRTLLIEEIRLFGQGGALADLVPMPFIDPFGQYKHDKWPGKVKRERGLRTRRQQEAEDLARAPALEGRDRYGGWAEGPPLEGTGWFRTAKVKGKWWLVTPEGHLFFSNGMDCVGTWGATFVEGRDNWFEALPDPNDERLAFLYNTVSGAHSMAESIDGKGRTCLFYRWNLLRKYGDDWPAAWREVTYRRLPSWGFNTIANWSQEDVLEHSPIPFVVSLGAWGEVREVEGARGYWGRMKDVFDPSFAAAVDRCGGSIGAKYAENPLCIGYFFDNEIGWETIRRGVLASPPDQPCRMAFIERLREKYGTVAGLNAAWGVQAADWDALRAPADENETAKADLDAFEYAFARRYFDAVNDGIKKHAPNQLYLGCRFSSAPAFAVRACADVADVVSFNLYCRRIGHQRFTGANDLGKPLLIGEFHFGALDRGMFHTGLVPTKDQADRAAHYVDYVRAVADCPAFVGCHWFQYVDEHTTGRWFDGENYNIGFVSITDSPYPELVEAARSVHAGLYRRRYYGPK